MPSQFRHNAAMAALLDQADVFVEDHLPFLTMGDVQISLLEFGLDLNGTDTFMQGLMRDIASPFGPVDVLRQCRLVRDRPRAQRSACPEEMQTPTGNMRHVSGAFVHAGVSRLRTGRNDNPVEVLMPDSSDALLVEMMMPTSGDTLDNSRDFQLAPVLFDGGTNVRANDRGDMGPCVSGAIQHASGEDVTGNIRTHSSSSTHLGAGAVTGIGGPLWFDLCDGEEFAIESEYDSLDAVKEVVPEDTTYVLCANSDSLLLKALELQRFPEWDLEADNLLRFLESQTVGACRSDTSLTQF